MLYHLSVRKMSKIILGRAVFHFTPTLSKVSSLSILSRSFSISSRRLQQEDLKTLWGILPKTGEKMPNSGPPKHEMAYFKGLATSTRAFGEFRRVLFTGLYSQLVTMEIPVGGDIGKFSMFLFTRYIANQNPRR